MPNTNLTPPAARYGWIPHEQRSRLVRKLADDTIAGMTPFFVALQSEPTNGKRVVLWDYTRRVNGGEHLPTYTQAIGDCVSQGAANAVNYLACTEIVRQGDVERFRPAYRPYLYGMGRVYVGENRIGRGDGSVGSWQAEAVRRYGVLAADEDGVPPYSGAVAKKWGWKPGPPKLYIEIADDFTIGSTALVTNYEQVRDALCNGYPVTVASSRGFKMRSKVDRGKHWGVPSGTWYHQMCFVGVDDDSRRPGCYVLNSWGSDAHGKPADDSPPGGFWLDADVVTWMVRQEDSFAYSSFEGFPEQLDFMVM